MLPSPMENPIRARMKSNFELHVSRSLIPSVILTFLEQIDSANIFLQEPKHSQHLLKAIKAQFFGFSSKDVCSLNHIG